MAQVNQEKTDRLPDTDQPVYSSSVKKTALVFGGNGLVGEQLVRLLLKDGRYGTVKVFGRHHPDISYGNFDFFTVNPLMPGEYAGELEGDDIFVCLGTTIKKAKSKENFRKVDYQMPLEIAKTGTQNGVSNFLVVSSIGADEKSRNFYLRTKGEMEEAVKQFNFRKIAILRPSMLLGKRKEFRFGELVSKVLMQLVGYMLLGNLRKYRGIQAHDVALSMIEIANQSFDEVVFPSDKLADIARKFKRAG